MDVVAVKGAKNMLLGGEGIFNTVVRGPGKVILQTMPISKVAELLQAVHDGLYERALQNRQNRTFTALNLEEMIQTATEQSGFIKAMWCGDAECEAKLKEVAGVSSRCMPFEQEHLSDTCVCCGKPAKTMVIWGKAY